MKFRSPVSFFVFIVSIALLDSSCSSNPKNELLFPSSPRVLSQPEQGFPGQKTPLSKPQLHAIEKATHIRDIFPIHRFITLENTDASVIGTIDKMVYLKGCFFILDKTQNQIFKFNNNGKFVRLIGRKGMGPGEYQHPRSLFIGWNQTILVSDMGKILRYGFDGKHLKTFEIRAAGHLFNSATGVVWQEKSKMYNLWFQSNNPNNPAHIALAKKDNSVELLYGFGNRFAFMEDSQRPNKLTPIFTDCFELVDGRIWIGSPYEFGIRVYDEIGRELAFLRPPYTRQLKTDDFENLQNKTQLLDMLGQKVMNAYVFKLGPLVLFYVTRNGMSITVYDANANLLKHNLTGFTPKVGAYTEAMENNQGHAFPLASDGESLVLLVPNFSTWKHYERFLTEKEIQLFKKIGGHPKDFLENNPRLAICRMVD